MRLCNNKLSLISNCCKTLTSRYSTSTKNVTERLVNRSLLKITGKDAIPLLQGLVTSDVNQLSNIGIGCQYTMFLNNKGRVLYDSIIYKIPESDTYLVEVDRSVVGTVQKHLNMYRLRRDVKIDNVDEKYGIWAHFNPNEEIIGGDKISENCKNPSGVDNATIKEVSDGKVIEFSDPRLSVLGSRLISNTSLENSIFEMYGKPTSPIYKHFRYRLGIGEGIEDFPIGNCFPLEANCDYLHGVSFHKGCYLGQELTARTHHTGVIRKRYMPVFFNAVVKTPPTDETVKAGEVNAGKLRGVEQDIGLGLLRIEKALGKDLVVGGMKCHTVRPFWWPCDKVEDKAVRL